MDCIRKIVAAVLHVGNIELNFDTFDDQTNHPCDIKDRVPLEKAATLLGTKADTLLYELTYRGQVMTAARAPCRPIEAQTQKDTLAKTLYNNLFSWLVNRMNKIIIPKGDAELYNKGIDPGAKYPQRRTIGLLDIYGFEKFDENLYEQLLINYTNEKLQKLYLSAVFEAEKIEFIKEGLSSILKSLIYTDRTTPVIELLDNMTKAKKQGIFKKIDDFKSNEEYPKLHKLILSDFKTHEYIQFQKGLGKDVINRFMIIHTAKEVMYTATEFIETNQDKMSEDLKALLYRGLDKNISAIMSEEEASSQGNTIWKKFRVQLADLMEELAERTITQVQIPNKKMPEPCELHFVRCVKPNETRGKNLFIETMVLQQIQYMGVLDTIRIRKVNYPNRRKYIQFYQRYEDLCSVSMTRQCKELENEGADFKELTKQIFREQIGDFGGEYYAYGNSKIFMKNEIYAVLEEARGKAVRKGIFSVFSNIRRMLPPCTFKMPLGTSTLGGSTPPVYTV